MDGNEHRAVGDSAFGGASVNVGGDAAGRELWLGYEVVDVGARKVTASAFGGKELDELFIITSREGIPADEDRAAGSLFKVVPGVSGLPVREFAG